MAIIRVALVLIPLWISVLFNVNMASHALTGSGSKARTGEIREETTALALFPIWSWQWLAPNSTRRVPFNTITRRFAVSEKTGRQHTGQELARTKREAHARTSARKMPEGITGEGRQEGRRQSQPSSCSTKTSRTEQYSIVEKASRRIDALSLQERSSFKKNSSAKQPSRSEKSHEMQTANPSNVSSKQIPPSRPMPQTRSAHDNRISVSLDYEEQTGSTMISSSSFETQGFTGVPLTTDHWQWWKLQTPLQTESAHNSSKCKKNLTSCVRNGTVWCGRVDPLSCSCDVNCKVYGDCCADFGDVCPSIAIKATARFRRHSDARVVCPAFTNHLFVCSVVTRKRKPKIIKSHCGMQKLMFGRDRLMTDPDTAISYVVDNAILSFSLGFRAWRNEAFFINSDDFDLNDAEAIRRELQTMDKVVMVAHPPPGVEGRPCVPDVIRTCPLPDEKMRQACSAVTSYMQYPATSEVFANKFCLACHGLDSCETLNASTLKPSDTSSPTSAVLVEQNIVEEVITVSLQRVNVSLSNHVNWQRVVCTIKNNVFRDCSFTECIADHDLQEGACIHVNRSVSVLVFVRHNLTQSSSSAVARPRLSVSPHQDGFVSTVFRDVVQNLTSQVLFDVKSGRNKAIVSPDPVWDVLVSLTFWTRLSDRQLSVAMETLTYNASQVAKESLEERGLVGHVSLCVRVSTELTDTACREESFSLLVSKKNTPPGQRGPSSSRAARWTSVFVVVWPSLALTVLFWQ